MGTKANRIRRTIRLTLRAIRLSYTWMMTLDDGRETDASLVARARGGDATAFETLVRRHYRAAYSVALATIGNEADAEDVCQDAFIRSLEKLDECREPAKFSTWLLRIVRNRAHNHRDYLNRRSAAPLDSISEPSSGPSPRPAERAELRDRLEAAIRTLPNVRRQVLLLHDLEGWRHREIAESLGISTGMSRQHLMHARRAVREILDGQLVDGGSPTEEEVIE